METAIHTPFFCVFATICPPITKYYPGAVGERKYYLYPIKTSFLFGALTEKSCADFCLRACSEIIITKQKMLGKACSLDTLPSLKLSRFIKQREYGQIKKFRLTLGRINYHNIVNYSKNRPFNNESLSFKS